MRGAARTLAALGALAVIVALLVGPAAYTSERTDDSMRLSALEYVGRLIRAPLDVDRRVQVPTGSLTADCAPVRGRRLVVCASYSRSGYAAVWVGDRPGGQVLQVLIADRDPTTVPNPQDARPRNPRP